MCLSGPLAAVRLRDLVGNFPCFEAHPKILFRELSGTSYRWKPEKTRMLRLALELLPGLKELQTRSDDEFDALLSAIAAYHAIRGQWSFDLYDLSKVEEEPLFRVIPAASYPWPVSVPSASSARV
jgi:hypothetical protein